MTVLGNNLGIGILRNAVGDINLRGSTSKPLISLVTVILVFQMVDSGSDRERDLQQQIIELQGKYSSLLEEYQMMKLKNISVSSLSMKNAHVRMDLPYCRNFGVGFKMLNLHVECSVSESLGVRMVQRVLSM